MTGQTQANNGVPETTRSLPFVLLRARENVMAPIRKMLSESGITEQQWRVLRVLAEADALDATTLADRACISFPSLTRIAHSMDQKGLISQRRDDRDRRRQVITITAAGQSIIDTNLDQAARIVTDFKARLGDENYDQLIDLLIALDR